MRGLGQEVVERVDECGAAQHQFFDPGIGGVQRVEESLFPQRFLRTKVVVQGCRSDTGPFRDSGNRSPLVAIHTKATMGGLFQFAPDVVGFASARTARAPSRVLKRS
jgi:hypothetical protein